MPLQKILFKPGVNRENTRYTTEGGWYECDKVRFRQGTPEKIGGWQRISATTFLGVCRSLWNWVTLGSQNLLGVGTHLKFYIENGGAYNDITPLRKPAATLGNNPFATTSGSTTVVVTDATGGFANGAFVTFSGATAVGGLTLNGEFQLTTIGVSASTYSITASSAASSTATGGGAAVVAAYQINPGPEYALPLVGWGAGSWGSGTWGLGDTSVDALRIWNQNNFGQNLIFGPRGEGLYYWDANTSLTTRGVLVSSLAGASDVPLYQNFLLVSDVSRFVLVFGTNDITDAILDPMLIRWSDQEDPVQWTPAPTNQAGSLRLSHGSQIVTAVQTRQEIVVFTDSSAYSLQYLGPPFIWGSQLLGDNLSIMGPNAVTSASGIIYWMGVDKFYSYDGRVQTLNCDLRRFVFQDLNKAQAEQIVAGTNEGFNEVWWFYCSANSFEIDKYVVFNYLENIWYYGTMKRTAWLDSGLADYPIAATYSNNIVNHEQGINNNETGTELAIEAYISSSEFDIGDGHNFGFVWRILPDLTFESSTNTPTGTVPTVTMDLYGLSNSGSGVTSSAGQSVLKGSSYVITEEFTGQIYTRVRGRQMIFKISSNQLNTTWQIGAPRIDIRPDGRR
jgi:hypothetical protein